MINGRVEYCDPLILRSQWQGAVALYEAKYREPRLKAIACLGAVENV